MIGLGLLILHVVIYSSIGICLYALRQRLSLIPLYFYLGILQVYVSIMSSFYIIDLGWGIQVGGGSIVYSAVIWSVMLLYIMERDPDLTKMVIYSLVAIQFVFLLVYPLIVLVLESTVVINPLLIPSEIFQTSFWIFVVGNLLALIELLTMIFLLERLTHSYQKIPPTILVVIVYIITLLVDGVLFPLFAFPVTLSISVVQGIASIITKMLLGVFFSITMLVAITILKPKFTEGVNGVTIRMADLFSLPKRDVVVALQTVEENRNMVRILLNLLSHDIANHNQSILTYLELLEEQNGDIIDSPNLKAAKQVVWETTDLVSNILDLNRIQSGPLQSEDVALDTVFSRALERVQRTYATVMIVVLNLEVLKGVSVNVHSLLNAVLYNVIANAIKHRNPENSEVILDLTIEKDEKYVTLGIGDRGPGIPDADKPLLFESLHTSEKTGIGLSIVKAILTRFHSHIWVENRPESPEDFSKGSVFFLKMPRGSIDN